MRLSPLIAAAIALLSSGPAAANDSTAEMSAGGLVLVRNNDIEMAKEDLYISPTAIRVDYIFRNRAKEARTYLIAFPLPDVEPDAYMESDISAPDRESDNFVGFKVTAGGQPVAAALEMRALSYGIDVTERLKSLNIPLNPLSDAAYKAVAALVPATASDLAADGIVLAGEEAPRPSWTLKSAFHWRQTFPADGDLAVTHSYTPGAGASFLYLEGLDESGERQEFCIDKGTEAALAKKLRALGEGGLIVNRRVSYILTTGANWAAPIGDFRLVVDKSNPDWVVSLCAEGLRKISPTQFELRKTNYAPDTDLHILFFEPVKPQQ